jgi:hypothetical protein
VPTIYAALLEAPIGDNDISSLEYAICGAAPMPAKLIEAALMARLKRIEGERAVRRLDAGLRQHLADHSIAPRSGHHQSRRLGLLEPREGDASRTREIAGLRNRARAGIWAR